MIEARLILLALEVEAVVRTVIEDIVKSR